MKILFWIGFGYSALVCFINLMQMFRGKEVSERVIAFICTLLQFLGCYFLWSII